VLEGGFAAAVTTHAIELDLLDATDQVLRSWMFDKAYPVKWSVADFLPEKNTVLLESIELAYATAKRLSLIHI
jgi:phage tail-like protein